MTAWLDTLLFGIYPYICLAVFFIGSWVRFDRDQYTWKSDSSQLLRTGSLRWGSNLFHVGVLFLFFGHTVGMLTPHFVYEGFMTAGAKQMMAMVTGGIAGVLAFIGLSILLHRRLSDDRIRATSKTSDILILVLLWLQLALGLATIPLSAQHLDGSMMLKLAEWGQRVVTFRSGGVELLAEAGWIFKAHMFLGMTIFLVFPFTRLVHVWSGFGTLAYLLRPYQVVRARRMNLPAGHMQSQDRRALNPPTIKEHTMSGCGTGSCGCGSTDSSVAAAPASTLTPTQAAAYEALAATMAEQVQPAPVASAIGGAVAGLARINGVALNAPHERLDEEALRQRACTELLRQAAQQAGLLSPDDVPGALGAISTEASDAIEQLLDRELPIPDPSEEACRRYHEAHPAAHAQGERAQLRHVLFGVTPGVDVKQLRLRAEALLIELRCADDGGAQFAKAAAQWSNCPSGQQGGDLGWLTRADCAPEFAREVFGSAEIGVLARLVHSRFGLHVVEVVARDPGQQPSFEEVRQAIALTLRQQAWGNALRQYLQLLAGAAVVEGVVLDAADTPLVQ